MGKFKPDKKKISFSDNTTIDIFVKTQIFAVLIYVIIFIIISSVALVADLPAKYDFLCSLLGFTISSFAVGFYVGQKLRQKGLLAGIIYSLPANTLVVLISLIFSDFSFGINIVITAIALLVTAGVGGIVAVNNRLKR